MFCKNCGSEVPEGIAFCAACGTPVAGAPAAAAPAAAAPKADKSGLIKLIAIIAVIAVVAGLFIGLLGGGSPKSVAKDFVKASIEGDMKKQMSLMAGKSQKYFEKVATEDEDELFENMEDACDEEDIDVKINNFNQFYKANKKYEKATNKDYYGKNYKVEVDVRDVIDMKEKVLDAYREMLDDDTCEEYINPDKIKKGKFVVVKVYIDGDEESDSYDTVVPVVKYKGSWKVLQYSLFLSDEDYEWGEDETEASMIISKAVSKARGDEVKEDED